MPWSNRRPQPLFRNISHTPRVAHLVNIAWASRPRDSRTLPFFVDSSQCVTRRVWGSRCPVITTSSRIDEYGTDEGISGAQKCGLQGVPVVELGLCDHLSDSQLADLAGEGMFIPNVACIMVACFLNKHATWWS